MAEKRARKLFVNLAVRDLKKSMSFFTKLGQWPLLPPTGRPNGRLIAGAGAVLHVRWNPGDEPRPLRRFKPKADNNYRVA